MSITPHTVSGNITYLDRQLDTYARSASNGRVNRLQWLKDRNDYNEIVKRVGELRALFNRTLAQGQAPKDNPHGLNGRVNALKKKLESLEPPEAQYSPFVRDPVQNLKRLLGQEVDIMKIDSLWNYGLGAGAAALALGASKVCGVSPWVSLPLAGYTAYKTGIQPNWEQGKKELGKNTSLIATTIGFHKLAEIGDMASPFIVLPSAFAAHGLVTRPKEWTDKVKKAGQVGMALANGAATYWIASKLGASHWLGAPLAIETVMSGMAPPPGKKFKDMEEYLTYTPSWTDQGITVLKSGLSLGASLGIRSALNYFGVTADPVSFSLGVVGGRGIKSIIESESPGQALEKTVRTAAGIGLGTIGQRAYSALGINSTPAALQKCFKDAQGAKLCQMIPNPSASLNAQFSGSVARSVTQEREGSYLRQAGEAAGWTLLEIGKNVGIYTALSYAGLQNWTPLVSMGVTMGTNHVWNGLFPKNQKVKTQ